MKILSENKDLLLNRRRIIYELDHIKQATPKKDGIRKIIADGLKVDENLVNVRFIKSEFGSGKSKVTAYVYNDAKTFNDIEVYKKKPKVKKDAKETKAKK